MILNNKHCRRPELGTNVQIHYQAITKKGEPISDWKMYDFIIDDGGKEADGVKVNGALEEDSASDGIVDGAGGDGAGVDGAEEMNQRSVGAEDLTERSGGKTGENSKSVENSKFRESLLLKFVYKNSPTPKMKP